MSAAVKRACDACHRRKVKCDGINPCRNCASAQLACTYNAVPQKKGPKGSRAKVISELRETQRQTSLSAKIQNRLNGIVNPPCSPSLSPTPGLLTGEMAKESIEFYFANMYPIMPIFNRRDLEQQAAFIDHNLEAYALVTSLCAFMMFQPGMTIPGLDPVLEHMPGTQIISASLLIEEAVRVRKGVEFLDAPNSDSLCTSYLLFACHYALDMHDKAWFYLREATTLAHMMGMSLEEGFAPLGTSPEASRRRHIYWHLHIAERAYALERGRPLSLDASIRPSGLTDDPSDPLAHQLDSHVRMINLFRHFDNNLITVWSKTLAECSPSYIHALQKQFADASQAYIHTHESDLQANQQWLKALSWRIGVQNGCVTQQGDEMHYPIDVRDPISITSQFSTQNTEILGVPLVAKLLEITCALTDVLAVQPSSGSILGNGPREQLAPLLQLLTILRNGEHHLLPLLIQKVHDILPRLANPMLLRAPENSSCNIDIFDGFGNAGLEQTSLITDFKAEPFTPSGVSHLEDMVPEPSNSNGSQPNANFSSPFPMVNSPAIMSPGVEYPHMNDFNSMGDVMSPLGHGSHQHHHQPAAPPPPTSSRHSAVSQHPLCQNQMMGNQMQGPVQSNMARGMPQAQNIAGLGQQASIGQNSTYPHSNSGLVGGVIHRQPQRGDSFTMHQQQPQLSRPVENFHALQRANTERMAINTIGLGNIQTDVDFSGL